jgi:tRNA uridine 5-carbamoylmethylation protein Kti12
MKMIILRGLPGSGKTYWIKENMAKEDYVVCSADHHFMVDGQYQFNPRGLGEAHAKSQAKAICSMAIRFPYVIVDNTNTQKWEWLVYETAAKALDYSVEIIDLFDGRCTDRELFERNTHGVPLASISAMRQRYER